MSEVRFRENPEAGQKIASWLLKLARLVRHQGQQTAEDRRAMVGDYAEMLLRVDLPPAAYNFDAMHYVADACDWWPPFATLAAKLQEHWAVQKVRVRNQNLPRLAGPSDAAPLSATDEQWVRFWRRNEDMAWTVDGETIADEHAKAARRRNGLSMIRRYAPDAYQRITGKQAEDRSTGQHWHDARQLTRTLRELQDHPVRADMLRTVKAAVENRAPEHIGLVQDAIERVGIFADPDAEKQRAQA